MGHSGSKVNGQNTGTTSGNSETMKLPNEGHKTSSAAVTPRPRDIHDKHTIYVKPPVRVMDNQCATDPTTVTSQFGAIAGTNTEARTTLCNSTNEAAKHATETSWQVPSASGDGGYQHEHHEIGNLKMQIHDLRQNRDDMAAFNAQLLEDKRQLEMELAAQSSNVNELRTRLSTLVSDRLTDNNPNIADLSDSNRPQKIAERYSELHSNEWSDAFDDLSCSKQRTEQENIDILLQFIKDIYKICFDISNNHQTDLKTQIMMYTGHIFKGGMQLNTDLSIAMKPFKEDRKHMFKAFLPTLLKETNTKRDIRLVNKKDKSKKLQKYLDLSTELCWLMCIQDPPVHLYTDCKKGTKFDETNFSAYTKLGDTVDFMVWPALHLYRGGSVLQKGSAQAKYTIDSKKIKQQNNHHKVDNTRSHVKDNISEGKPTHTFESGQETLTVVEGGSHTTGVQKSINVEDNKRKTVTTHHF